MYKYTRDETSNFIDTLLYSDIETEYTQTYN